MKKEVRLPLHRWFAVDYIYTDLMCTL